MWGIAYKEDPSIPSTAGGCVMARVETFDTEEQAQKFLDDRNEWWLHPVEIGE